MINEEEDVDDADALEEELNVVLEEEKDDELDEEVEEEELAIVDSSRLIAASRSLMNADKHDIAGS